MAPTALKQKKFRRTLLRMWLLPPFLLLALVAVLLWQIDKLLETERSISKSNEFIAQANRVERLLVDMETGTRGYLLTSESAFLEPYTRALPVIGHELELLANLASSNSSSSSSIAGLRELELVWQARMRNVATMVTSTTDRGELLRSSGTKQNMDQMREILAFLVTAEQQTRDQLMLAGARSTRLIVGLSIGLTLVLGLGIALLSQRQFLSLFKTYNRALSEVEAQANAVAQSEKRYRLLFANNPHPMWLYDTETLAFLEVNDAAIAHYGYTREEFLSMTIKDIRPIKDLPALLHNVANLQNRIDRAGIWKHRRKDGALIDVEITSHVLQLSGRQADLVLANDVTEKLHAERGLMQLNNRLEQIVVERTSELETTNKELEAFTYSVSHDLRAPLRAINGFSRILLEEFSSGLPVPAVRYLEHVRTNAKQMGQLIDDLLAFSRISRQSLKKQLLDPADIVELVLDEMKLDQQEREVEVALAKLPHMDADPALLKQVFTNLLSNAFKYTRGRSPASIDIGATYEPGMSAGPIYFVRDNGAGFDMKYADKLFGVFQRLHRAEEFEGTGVGLATTERIVRRHGGRIWAEAEVDRGATFFFTIAGEPVNDGKHG